MKVLFINTLYPPNIVGGAEKSTAILAETLVKMGLKVTVITLSPDKKPRICETNGVKIYYVALKNFFFPFGEKKQPFIFRIAWMMSDTKNISMAQTVAAIIDKEIPDLVHTHSLLGFSTQVWNTHFSNYKLPVVHTPRDYYLICPRGHMYKRNNPCKTICIECRIFSYSRIQASKKLDGVIGISNFFLQKHLVHGAFENTPVREVIHNPFSLQVHTTNYQKDANKNLSVRFGYFGRLDPTKGIENLLVAVKNLSAKNIELWVGGDGPEKYKELLRNRYQDNRIHFLGFMKPEDFFPHIDVLVQPSLWNEPFGRTIIEAYAYGKPVLISQRGGSPELVDKYETGLIFEPNNTDELETCLQWYINNPQALRELEINCFKKSQEFLPEKIANQTIITYEKILHRL